MKKIRKLNKRYRVIEIDNLVTGNVHNISDLAGNANFKFIQQLQQHVAEFLFPNSAVDFVWHSVSPAFISQTFKKKPLTTLGQGRQTRSFFYGSDLTEGVYWLMMSAYAQTMNIGTEWLSGRWSVETQA